MLYLYTFCDMLCTVMLHSVLCFVFQNIIKTSCTSDLLHKSFKQKKHKTKRVLLKKFGSQRRLDPMVWTQVSWTLPWDSNTFAMETLENLETCFVLSWDSVEWQVFPDRSDLKNLSFLPFFLLNKNVYEISSQVGFRMILRKFRNLTHSSFIVVSSQISHHPPKNITSNH